MSDTLAHGTFHTLLAIRQCGADAERVFHVVAIVVNVAVIAVDECRIVIVDTLRAEPPCNPVPVVWKRHDSADCPYLTVAQESLKPLRYNHCFNISIPYIISFAFVLRRMGQHIAAHHLLT